MATKIVLFFLTSRKIFFDKFVQFVFYFFTVGTFDVSL